MKLQPFHLEHIPHIGGKVQEVILSVIVKQHGVRELFQQHIPLFLKGHTVLPLSQIHGQHQADRQHHRDQKARAHTGLVEQLVLHQLDIIGLKKDHQVPVLQGQSLHRDMIGNIVHTAQIHASPVTDAEQPLQIPPFPFGELQVQPVRHLRHRVHGRKPLVLHLGVYDISPPVRQEGRHDVSVRRGNVLRGKQALGIDDRPQAAHIFPVLHHRHADDEAVDIPRPVGKRHI